MTAPAGQAAVRTARDARAAALRDWAADAAAEEPGGDARGAVRLGLATLVALCVALGGWGLGGRVAGVIAVPGVVAVPGGPLPVAAAEAGIVAHVAVRDGDRVAAGALLLRLDTAALDLEAARLSAEAGALAARRARLLAEAEGRAPPPAALPAALPAAPPAASVLPGGPEARLAAATQAAEAAAARRDRAADRALTAEAAGLAATRAAAERQRALIGAALADKAALARAGIARRAEVQALEREAARLDGLVDATTAEIAALAARAAASRLDRAAEAAQRRAEARAALVDIAATDRALAARRAELALRRARADLRAPAAGEVFALRVAAPGAVVGAGAVLVRIVPEAPARIVTARLDPARAAAAAPGQPARVLIPAAIPGAAADLAARVLRVAAEAEADAQTGARWVEVTLETEAGAALPRPGTPVEVFLSTGEAAPLAWLAAPLARHWARVFRDG